VFHFFPVT